MMHRFSRWIPHHAGRGVRSLDDYWAGLRRGSAPEPPADLPSDVAEVAARISNEIPANDASEGFVRRLRAQLEDAHAAQAAQPDTHMWTGPAIGPNSRGRTPVRETEEQQIMPASIDPTTSLEKGRRSRELWKFAAAIAVFAVVGALLVLLLRDDDDEPQIVEPGPSPTVAPTPASTPSAAQSPTSTLEPEATSTLAATATEGISGGLATLTAEAVATEAAVLPPDWSTVDVTVTEIPVDGLWDWIVHGADSIWVSFADKDGREKVARIDPATNEVVATIDTGGYPYAASDAAVYVIAFNSPSAQAPDVLWIDTATNQVAGQHQGPEGFDPNAVAVSNDAVWVANRAASNAVFRFDNTGTLNHIDPDTMSVITTYTIPNADGSDTADVVGFAVLPGSIWAVGLDDELLYRIDPVSGEVVGTVNIGFGVQVMVVADGSLWLCDHERDVVLRVSPSE